MTITSDESFIILTTVTLSFEAELNLPYYPLLRRNVDCIIALDASADSQVGAMYQSPKLLWPSLKRGLVGFVVYTCRT